PGGRLREQRDRAWEVINAIPGVSCVKPRGAIYLFPRLDPAVHSILDDEKMIFDLLTQEKMLLVQGSAFNYPEPDHFRVVFLPRVEDIEEAFARFARFISGYRQA
ncbi:MAG TPA: aminotransferase class I/II-fold pyridoxal phosphate-dependent enzyme, partial [Pseudomonadales bacterium]|nr:aminotransferase class I/II-fold pyridoxal phosphate-dependent enzyme [Pseudomonadales bacterium]